MIEINHIFKPNRNNNMYKGASLEKVANKKTCNCKHKGTATLLLWKKSLIALKLVVKKERDPIEHTSRGRRRRRRNSGTIRTSGRTLFLVRWEHQRKEGPAMIRLDQIRSLSICRKLD